MDNDSSNAELTTLGNVLQNSNRFDPGHWLYMPSGKLWDFDTKCAVLADSDLDGVPEAASRNGLSCALEIAAVQDVAHNAREQLKDVTVTQLVQAFLFFYKHDAFVAWEGGPGG